MDTEALNEANNKHLDSPRLIPLPSFSTPPSQTMDPTPDQNRMQATAPDPLDEAQSPKDNDPESPRTGTFTRPRLKPGGNREDVAKVIGGLIVILTATLGILAQRSGRSFRQPTPQQRDEIANPLASIAVRHLPLDVIGEDLADVTQAAVATHSYIMAGPLTGSGLVRNTDGEFANLGESE